MIVIGVAGGESFLQKSIAESMVGKSSPCVWSFFDDVHRVTSCFFRLGYDDLHSPEGLRLVDPALGLSRESMVDLVRESVPVDLWRQALVKRLVDYPPCNHVVLCDLDEEWQAEFVRRCGGGVVHLSASDDASDSPVLLDREAGDVVITFERLSECKWGGPLLAMSQKRHKPFRLDMLSESVSA